MKKTLAAAVVAALVATAGAASAQTVMVGGMAMYPTKDIVDNAVNSADHTTLVAAVKAADLVNTLKSKGPFTVFAPVNDAFKDLPDGTVATLLRPENKATLAKILTYHVVSGRLEADDLREMIRRSNGRATLHTVSGGMLYASMNGPRNIVIKDEAGNTAHISTYDVNQSNGVIQVIDKVLMPKM